MERSRIRELGIVIGHLTPGANNAITDVAGVRVGHVTLISGEGKRDMPPQLPWRVRFVWTTNGDSTQDSSVFSWINAPRVMGNGTPVRACGSILPEYLFYL